MNSNNTTTNYMILNNVTIVTYSCMTKTHGSFAIFLAIIACPVYFLMFKILIQRFDLRLPRHKILLSLNISDSIQIAGMALLNILGFISQAKSSSTGCQVIRKSMEFLGIATVVSASGSILLLAYERYVACVHCLRLYDIVTDNLVHRALYCIWAVALICGFADEERYEADYNSGSALPKTTSIIYTAAVLTSAIILTCVQARLYLLSRKKMKVLPVSSFGAAAEEKETRKVELKVAIVASAVVALYMICMCPAAFYLISVGFESKNDVSTFRVVSMIFTQLNTVADPFVYGFGMADTRQQMLIELRKMKAAVVDLISRIFNL